MPKRKRKNNVANSMFELSGLTSAPANESLEECLLELEGTPTISTKGFSASTNNKVKRDSDNSEPKAESDVSKNASLTMLSERLREKVADWNAAFQKWNKENSYTEGLLPSFDVELARHFQVKELSAYLLETCPHIRMPAFERWLIDSKLEQKQQRTNVSPNMHLSDPVLPELVTVEFESSQRLITELVEGDNMDRAKAVQTVRELCQRTRQSAIPEIRSQVRRCAQRIPFRKGDRIFADSSGQASIISLTLDRKKWTKPFTIKLNADHYNRLKHRFLAVHSFVERSTSQSDHTSMEIHGKETKACHAFHLIVMVLTLRYSSFSGGQLLDHLRGGGMQGAVHPEVIQCLRDPFENQHAQECFASPFNVHLQHYNSAFFDDIDWHFGSGGDFFDSPQPTGAFLEANPPFSPGLMTLMVKRFEDLLQEADKNRSALTIAVVVPTATKSAADSAAAAKRFAISSFQRMIKCQSCRLHIVLKSREHGYVEGAQHIRPTLYKDSSYDTSIILLQSKCAMEETLLDADYEQSVRGAFRSRHSQEIESRRCQLTNKR